MTRPGPSGGTSAVDAVPPAHVPPQVAFVCRQCGDVIGDPLYCGPAGHAPQDVCYSCWLDAFEQPRADWPRKVLALWFISNGYSKAEAARRCGVDRWTVWHWLTALRKNIREFLKLISDLDGLDALRRY